jgi:hypothetical protein
MAGTITRTFIEHRARGVVRNELAITCDASGVASATVAGVGFGRLIGVFYNGGLDASASITVKDAKSGATVFGPYVTGTEGTPVTLRPSQIIATNAGAAVTAADTAPNVNRAIYVGGKLTVEVSSGGISETCILALIVDEVGIGDLALTV